MSNEHVFRGIRTPFARQQHRRCRGVLGIALVGALVGGAVPALAGESSSAPNCTEVYDPNATYPGLPDVQGPDVSGKAGVIIYLHEDRAVVELDGCFYLADRPLVIDFAGLDFVSLLVELPSHPEGAQVFVTENDEWVETLEVSASMFSYIMGPDHALGFEILVPGYSAPTGPVIITKPSTGNPDPK